MARILVTGGSGFIGSHICNRLISMEHEVVCLDNLMTSKKDNISHLLNRDGFRFIEGDIRDGELVSDVLRECTHVCHQAALGSVPRSIKDPITTNDINLSGSLNVLSLSMQNGIRRFVYASSSSVYGDDLSLPKVEERTGEPLSPYAVTKSAFEKYAKVFNSVHGMETIGLRYFNVFGPRQSPSGEYAAVIPKFIDSILRNVPPTIFGDGEQTRDFTYVDNVVEANILALFGDIEEGFGSCFNVACGGTVSIKSIFYLLLNSYREISGIELDLMPEMAPVRAGDVKDSLASLEKIEDLLGYVPSKGLSEGLKETVQWHLDLGN